MPVTGLVGGQKMSMNIHQQYGKAYQELQDHIWDHGEEWVLDAIIQNAKLPVLRAMLKAIEEELEG